MFHGGIRNGYKRASLEQENKTGRKISLPTSNDESWYEMLLEIQKKWWVWKDQAEDLLKWAVAGFGLCPKIVGGSGLSSGVQPKS